MSVTDQSLIKEAQYSLLENGDADANGTSMLTSMFTITQLIDALNQSQDRFLRDTGIVLAQSGFVASQGQGLYDLPTDCIAPRRVAWRGADGVVKALVRSDTWEQDHGLYTWPVAAQDPISWYENPLPNLRVGLAPPPSNAGQAELLYIQLGQTLTGAGIALLVPDDWTPYVKWSALSLLLSADGEGFDPQRAAYCEQRYMEGVELARLVLGDSTEAPRG